MRISSQAVFQQSISTLQRLQSDLAGIQNQIATGRRIQEPSDDPIGAARSLDLQQSIATLDQYTRNTGLAENRLRLEEETLTGVAEVLQRVRELSLQAANATQTPETRSYIAVEIRQRLDEVLAYANARDAQDEYLFSGYQTKTQPFTKSGAGYNYNGDQGQRFIQISDSRRLADSDPGDEIFARLRQGNGTFVAGAATGNTGAAILSPGEVNDAAAYNYGNFTINFPTVGNYEVSDALGTVIQSGSFESGDTLSFAGISVAIDGEPASGDQFTIAPSANTDIFSILENISATLDASQSNPMARANLVNNLNQGILGLDSALGNVLEARTRIGARLSASESQLDTNEGVKLVLQGTLGDIQDLDYAEAISALTQRATTLQAAQQSFVKIQGLSLFNYL